MVVRAGNGRLEAMKAMGWKTCAAVIVDEGDVEATAFSIADNRSAELAEWDTEELAQALNMLIEEDPSLDLEALGWSDEDMMALEELFPEEKGEGLEETEEEDFSIPEVIPTETSFGDVVKLGKHTLHCNDCLDVMRSMKENSIDAIVTDPPYGIGLDMGAGWDCDVPGNEFAEEALRILKPGGYIVSFAACRTIHVLMTNLEQAGFEIRDLFSWLFFTGFPKSLNIGGLGTGLKPAQEPAVIARKPLEGTVENNLGKWNTGLMNIDSARLSFDDDAWPNTQTRPELEGKKNKNRSSDKSRTWGIMGADTDYYDERGRWPANIYYCKKPSRSEREEGCDDLPSLTGAQTVNRKEGSKGLQNPRAGAGRTAEDVKNIHPTVKPIKLMRQLVKLMVPNPNESVVFEPFCGSGTTLIAAELEGVSCVAVEKEERYCDIIRARFTSTQEDQ